ncbi:expressed unknown protein [Ectocarpus siliculosus]|uniref:Uncharacterized protein n=1 Tax=Ectocarpus siliculosus TaxID=2880 RepID=D7FWT7_ECTSI|nr:expressed unknown protein [Ectocarpus siliculosus]|eukprot:CBJ32175.1 expressed unknown protein [Ectocarpus siliculosus]
MTVIFGTRLEIPLSTTHCQKPENRPSV